MAPKRPSTKRKKSVKSPFDVLQFSMLGQEVSVHVDEKLWVSFIVERGGKTYGNKVQARSGLPVDVVAAAFLLACNAVDSIKSFDTKSEN